MGQLMGGLIAASGSRIVVTGLLFLLTLGSGVWLSNSGRPSNVGIFTVHRLIALVTVISIAVTIYQLNRDAGIRTTELAAIAVTGLPLLCLFASGALLSAGKPVSDAPLAIHRAAPLLTLVSTAATIYLLISGQAAKPI